MNKLIGDKDIEEIRKANKEGRLCADAPCSVVTELLEKHAFALAEIEKIRKEAYDLLTGEKENTEEASDDQLSSTIATCDIIENRIRHPKEE